MEPHSNPTTELSLRDAFQQRLYELDTGVNRVTANPADTKVLEDLGDGLDEFVKQLDIHGSRTFAPSEITELATKASSLQVKVGTAYQHTLNSSHHGRPVVAYRLRSHRRGRPAVVIDPNFLRQAYPMRGVSGLARFLGCSRSRVRKELLELGLAQPGPNPFRGERRVVQSAATLSDIPDLIPIHSYVPDFATHSAPTVHSETHHRSPLAQPERPASAWSTDEIDEAILHLRGLYPRAGISILDGMLRRLGFPLSREAIGQSLIRLTPADRVFDRLRIERRTYSVPGPNSLWHHDGQHGLIRWKIILHGFIDGYSRLITGLRASNNNYGSTVLDVFLSASRVFGVPSRLRGDHGTENIEVATWMEATKGVRRGSYIWGRSVHNVRIERLWVDVTAQFGSKWAAFFTVLELHHGLDVSNPLHLWLLHFLFLGDINADAAFFAEAWNHHKLKIKGQASRSPHDMFFFDMITNGLRGDVLEEGDVTAFGIDWDALNTARAASASRLPSWVGQPGPPPNLSEVPVEPPANSGLSSDQIATLYAMLLPYFSAFDETSKFQRWSVALAYARTCNPEF